MIVTLQTERVQTLADVRAVIDGNDRLDYQFTDREAAYEFIRRTLVRFDYPTLSKPDKGIIGRYLAKMTGLSRAQMTRLVGQHRATGRVTDRRGGAPVRPFERRYTGADIRLLAEADAALGDMSGPATRAVMRREFEVFGQRLDAPPPVDAVWQRAVLTQPQAIAVTAAFCKKRGAIKFFDAGDVQGRYTRTLI